VLILNVAVKGGVSLDGLKLAEAPLGRPEAESETLKLEEVEAETVILEPASYHLVPDGLVVPAPEGLTVTVSAYCVL